MSRTEFSLWVSTLSLMAALGMAAAALLCLFVGLAIGRARPRR